MPVPVAYRRTTEGAIASYNYTDIAEGTGIVLFYGFNHYSNSSEGYGLTTGTFYSQYVYTSGSTPSDSPTPATHVKAVDVDLDVTFNMPQRIKGKLRAIIPHNHGNKTDPNQWGKQYVYVRVRKYSGTTETEIADASGAIHTGANQQIKQWIDCIEIPINTIATFKKGDRLRMTIEVWNFDREAGGILSRLIHDPGNTTTEESAAGARDGIPQDEGGTPRTAQLKIFVPFVLDL